ncbi:hypothetical protein Tco_0059830 [Tanacetum coccineum]
MLPRNLEVHELETSSARLLEKVAVYENCMSQLEKFQDERMKEVNDKFDKLDVDVIEMALHLEERFYPHLLTTIVGRSLSFGLQESQPHEDQLMVPIHHSPDQTVVGATSLSFSLDVSRNRVQKIRDNIANHRSALRGVFVSIVEPLSSVTLEGTKSTSGIVPETTTALSVTFAPVSSTPSISMDDYEIAHADDQGNAGADVDPFPNVDDAELIIS